LDADKGEKIGLHQRRSEPPQEFIKGVQPSRIENLIIRLFRFFPVHLFFSGL